MDITYAMQHESKQILLKKRVNDQDTDFHIYTHICVSYTLDRVF